MLKPLMGAVLVLSVMVCATGLARAQTAAATSAPPTATESMPAPATAADSSSRLFSVSELVAIGAGAVVGGMLVQATLYQDLALFGAAAGGWVGDWMYGQRTPHKVGG